MEAVKEVGGPALSLHSRQPTWLMTLEGVHHVVQPSRLAPAPSVSPAAQTLNPWVIPDITLDFQPKLVATA